MISNIKKDRRSIFREVGLAPDNAAAPVIERPTSPPLSAKREPSAQPTVLAPLDTRPVEQDSTAAHACESDTDRRVGTREDASREITWPVSEASSPQSRIDKTPWYAKLATGRRPRARTASNAPPSPMLGLPTVTMLVMAVALVAPLVGQGNRDFTGVADAGPIIKRADSATDVCARWAQQSELISVSSQAWYRRH